MKGATSEIAAESPPLFNPVKCATPANLKHVHRLPACRLAEDHPPRSALDAARSGLGLEPPPADWDSLGLDGDMKDE